jgi:hypothetical protein
MNTLAYADVDEANTSQASTIASTLQQLSMSFGVAVASLMTALVIPNRFHSDAAQMIRGIHIAVLCLGGLTILFGALRGVALLQRGKLLPQRVEFTGRRFRGRDLSHEHLVRQSPVLAARTVPASRWPDHDHGG